MRRACLFLCLAALAAFAEDPPWPTDGWPASTPEEQGMDSAVLERADDWIRANSPNRYSLLIVRNGRLVFERYYNGAGERDARHIASISKSILSALTGIAVEQGLVDLEDRWFEAFPQYSEVVNDARTTELRIRNMLMMSAGLEWVETLDAMKLWVQSPDWMRSTLAEAFSFEPGEGFHYSTGLTHMLSSFLTLRTGMSALEFARWNLFAPIGITPGEWWRDPRGVYSGGFGMHITPRDLAKFGYLFLRDGMWDGARIVPASWVRASTSPLIRCGAGADDFYGYLWWMDNYRGFFIPNARGMGSQRIWFSRELDLLVVSTGDYANPAAGSVGRLVSDYAIPAVFRGAPVVNPGGVVNAASGVPAIAPDSFASIYGENFAPAEVAWNTVILDDRTLPAELGGIKVKIAGISAYVSYAGPWQVNVLVPPGVPPGPAEVVVSHPGGSFTAAVTVAAVSPALFSVATIAGGNVTLYATGLGATADSHPAGQVLSERYPIAEPSSVRVLFGDTEAVPHAVNMTSAGVWQIDVRIPAECPAGDAAVRVRVGGETSPAIHVQIPSAY